MATNLSYVSFVSNRCCREKANEIVIAGGVGKNTLKFKFVGSSSRSGRT